MVKECTASGEAASGPTKSFSSSAARGWAGANPKFIISEGGLPDSRDARAPSSYSASLTLRSVPAVPLPRSRKPSTTQRTCSRGRRAARLGVRRPGSSPTGAGAGMAFGVDGRRGAGGFKGLDGAPPPFLLAPKANF